MNARQDRKRRSMVRSVNLLRTRNVKGPQFEPLIRDLEKKLERLDVLLSEQGSASKRRTGWADVIERLRGELRDRHMFRISRRGPSLMKWAPGAADAFKLPHQTAGNATLIASARAMVKVVALKPTLFTKDAGFPKGFLAEFRGAIKELEQTIAAAKENTRQLSRLTAELDRLITHGRAQQRVLDGLLRPLLHDDWTFAKAWREAWLIPAKLGRPKKKKKKKNDDEESEEEEDTPPSSEA